VPGHRDVVSDPPRRPLQACRGLGPGRCIGDGCRWRTTWCVAIVLLLCCYCVAIVLLIQCLGMDVDGEQLVVLLMCC
jgi:hypothetical protein